jgi:hypothetical protein
LSQGASVFKGAGHYRRAALIAIRNGTNAYGRWGRIVDSIRPSAPAYHEHKAESDRLCDRLYWVEVTDPEGVEKCSAGGGTSPAEAAAVINTWAEAWLAHDTTLSDEDYAKVARVVPEGWQFELYKYKRPVRPTLTVIEGSRDLSGTQLPLQLTAPHVTLFSVATQRHAPNL